MTIVRPERLAGAAVAAALVVSVPVLAVEVPERPMGRVSDYAGLLRSEDRERIEARLEEFERRTTNQVAVAIFPSLPGEDLEDFTNRLFERWRLGQREKNNGVLLVIDLEGRRARIEVGYGLEPSLTDALSRRILERDLLPRFRARDYAGGIAAAAESILAATGGERVAVKAPGERPTRRARAFGPHFFAVATLAVSIILFFLFPLLRRFAGGTVLYDARGRRRYRRRGGSWWTVSQGGWGTGSGSFGGGSSGGGFSGGGGLSGGGGASGSW